MDDDNDREWMERFVAVATSDIITTTTSSFPVAWNRSHAARLLQESLTRTCISGSASGANVSSRSPRPDNKQPKRRRSSMAGEKNKRTKVDAPESSLVAMMSSPPSEPDAQHVEVVTPAEDDVSTLWGEFDLVDNANSRYRAPIVMPSTARQSIGFVPSSVGEHPTSSAAFDAVVSHSSTPSASSPPSSTPSTAISFPSPSTLTSKTSNPALVPNHEEGVPLPDSPAKWAEVQDAIFAANDRDLAAAEKVTNLEATLNSKVEELAAAGVKHARDVDTSLPLDSDDAAV
nr:putative protein TPRXL [Nicotiana tomentosiformis]